MGVHPRNKCHINYLSPLLGTHCAAKSQHSDIKEPSSVVDHHLLSIISGDFIFLALKGAQEMQICVISVQVCLKISTFILQRDDFKQT